MPQKRYHEKVRSGCGTCRKRRIKCDETRPNCVRCTRSGYRCEGYRKLTTWLFEPTASGKGCQSKAPSDGPTDMTDQVGSASIAFTTTNEFAPDETISTSSLQAGYAIPTGGSSYDHRQYGLRGTKSENIEEYGEDGRFDGSQMELVPLSKGSKSNWTYYVGTRRNQTSSGTRFINGPTSRFNIQKQLPPSYMDGLLAHANACFWPQLLAIAGKLEAQIVLNAWFNMITNSSMIFNANLYSFGKHFHLKRKKRPTRDQAQQVLQYQTLALESTYLEIDRVLRDGTPPSDDLITTVLLLASFEKVASYTGQQSTSSDTGRNKGYENRLAHHHILPVLVDMRGGLDGITFPGIADRIFWRDILISTFWVRHPTYPARRLSPVLQPDPAATLDNFTGADEIFGFLEIFANLVDNEEMESKPDRPSFGHVFVIRLQIQHSILSLPISMTRTAILLFSDMHIVPMPPHVNHRQRLANILRSQITQESEEIDVKHKIWCLAVGGMASTGPTRAWFVQNMAKMCQKQNLKEMSVIRTSLSDIHWCQVAFASTMAKEFWNELADTLEISFPFEKSHEWIPRRLPAFADSGPFIQTLVTEYVL